MAAKGHVWKNSPAARQNGHHPRPGVPVPEHHRQHLVGERAERHRRDGTARVIAGAGVVLCVLPPANDFHSATGGGQRAAGLISHGETHGR